MDCEEWRFVSKGERECLWSGRRKRKVDEMQIFMPAQDRGEVKSYCPVDCTCRNVTIGSKVNVRHVIVSAFDTLSIELCLVLPHVL